MDDFGSARGEEGPRGVLIAYHLTLRGEDVSLTACGLRQPALASSRHVNVSFLPRNDVHFTARGCPG